MKQQIDTGQLPSRVTWLEDEYRQSKTQLIKMQQQMEQLWGLQRDRALWQDDMDRSVVTLRGHVSKTAGLDETTRQLRERLSGLQEDFAAHTQMNEKAERLQQADGERVRQALTEHWHRMELIQKEAEGATSKVAGMLDTLRRQQEGLGQVMQALDDLRGDTESLATRQQLLSEQLRRLEAEFSRVEQEFEPLRKQDEVLMSKVQIVAEQSKRTEEAVSVMANREHLLHDLTEKLQVYRLEQQRQENGLSEVKSVTEDQALALEEHERALKSLEERRVALSDYIAQIQTQIVEYREDSEDKLAEYEQMVEQQKLRELTELERQVRECKEKLAHLRSKSQ